MRVVGRYERTVDRRDPTVLVTYSIEDGSSIEEFFGDLYVVTDRGREYVPRHTRLHDMISHAIEEFEREQDDDDWFEDPIGYER